jgi:hypothetical protein
MTDITRAAELAFAYVEELRQEALDLEIRLKEYESLWTCTMEDRAAANAEWDKLWKRVEAAEQALEAFALCTDELEAAGFHVLAALARQPSQEQVVPCDQHDAGHQAGWA